MDTQKEERARGVTISCTTKEFYTVKWHYTIIDAPGMHLQIGVAFTCFATIMLIFPSTPAPV